MCDTLEKELDICEHRILVDNVFQCRFDRYCHYKKEEGRRHYPDFRKICTYKNSQDDIWK